MVIGLPPTPDLEKVRTGNYSLIWSGLRKSEILVVANAPPLGAILMANPPV